MAYKERVLGRYLASQVLFFENKLVCVIQGCAVFLNHSASTSVVPRIVIDETGIILNCYRELLE